MCIGHVIIINVVVLFFGIFLSFGGIYLEWLCEYIIASYTHVDGSHLTPRAMYPCGVCFLDVPSLRILCLLLYRLLNLLQHIFYLASVPLLFAHFIFSACKF